jgi:hypothetical protein
MRTSLLHPLAEPRHGYRRRKRSAAPTPEAPVRPEAPARECDLAVKRVREAGGPIDEASYSCSCGYLFSASVSTTVCCPHCGASQAW